MTAQKPFRNAGRPRPTDNWRTPLDLYARTNAEFRFTVDAACTTEDCLAPFGLYRDLGADAFLEDWGPRGSVVWCNPPFSHYARWVRRALVQRFGRTIVMLLPADSSTRTFRHDIFPNASEIRFLAGRPRFRKPDGSTPVTRGGGGGVTVPCLLAIFGESYPVSRFTFAESR